MQPSLYVSLSGQLSLMRRLDTLAHNVANVNTAGFRAEEIKFEQLISQKTDEPTAFVSTGQTYLSRQAGEVVRTENPLDIAVTGDAWLAFQGPNGPVYTRDGRMTMTPEGELRTLTGYPVLDVGGAPIQLNPNGGPPSISRDGTMTQGQNRVGAVGLFTIPDQARLSRFENSGVMPDMAAEPALDFSRVGLLQGFMEQANVNPVSEISRLIQIQRSFDSISNSIAQSEQTLTTAIKTLGETS
ncbi:MAG: flagellar basal-body rod protein FlgF [Hyphomicrobium zavarzinii]|jgi:flagellar basal-body rod protein FlgF|uniref:flagellar basal-body rod protein FlgF n=1 Tax=Hyphomicrobium TaxID=81 RepID=UPI00037BAC65|nr:MULTISPECIES: flagellar basal-body rod protein FlgF [Hyphomicrobium]MBL8847781.1 flagellar basal-body rod protein FlgF [Hyphomicrobium zavarzinii]WBT39250.1 flagellar basal-body rod protein FlgF [Hyphomicrobium sp. DMF-1]HML43025.1 flagellar basal-body rod protein FlgF [Hyphomicrobium zavarzinii]